MKPRRGERQGEDAETTAGVLVSAGPGECPFQRRHKATTNLAGPNWFVVFSFDGTFSHFWYERLDSVHPLYYCIQSLMETLIVDASLYWYRD